MKILKEETYNFEITGTQSLMFVSYLYRYLISLVYLSNFYDFPLLTYVDKSTVKKWSINKNIIQM